MGRRYRKKTSIAKIVRKELVKRVEVKSISQALHTVLDSNGVMRQLYNNIHDGSEASQRIGNEISVLSNQVKVLLQAQNQFNHVRYMLVRTREPIMAPEDVFDPLEFAQIGASYAGLNYNIVSKVYINKNFAMNLPTAPQSVAAGALQPRISKFKNHYVKTRNSVKYNETLGDPMAYVYFIAFSNDLPAAPSNTKATCTWLLKTRFTDM